MINQTAVDNFLSTMDMNSPSGYHRMNAVEDFIRYGWNRETLAAINKGIFDAYRRHQSCTRSNTTSEKQ